MPAEVCGVGNSRNGKLGFVEKLRLRCGTWLLGNRQFGRIGNGLTLSLGQERREKSDQRQDRGCDTRWAISGWICGHAKTPHSTSAHEQKNKISCVPNVVILVVKATVRNGSG